jgi:uncharacterized repeat protein (TIGR03803 family)
LRSTTKAGGSSSLGTAFSMTPSGTFNCVHSFTGADGAYPIAPPVEGLDGNYYGTTSQGGPTLGVIYKMTRACVVTVLYGFPGFASPNAPLLLASDGHFYGTTVGDGTGGDGTVFRMTKNGAVTVIYNFDYTNGAQPYSPVIQGNDGNLYGTAYTGGASNAGVVFQVTRSGKFTVLHAFNGADGSNPYAGLAQATDGTFYGATSAGGGSGSGTLFKVTAHGVFSNLENFTAMGSAGYMPQVSLVQHTNGLLYGENTFGGIAPAELNEGAGGHRSVPKSGDPRRSTRCCH